MFKPKKYFSLLSGTVDNQHWCVQAIIEENGSFRSKGALQYQQKWGGDKVKRRIRVEDRRWVYRNIPSSIHWYTEVHHDWHDEGRMYLLTKGEHILKTRKERNQ